MSSHLQPAVEAAMVMEQQPTPLVDDITARRDVAGDELATREGVGRVVQQLHDRPVVTPLQRIRRTVIAKLPEQASLTAHPNETVAKKGGRVPRDEGRGPRDECRVLSAECRVSVPGVSHLTAPA